MQSAFLTNINTAFKLVYSYHDDNLKYDLD